MRAQTSLGGIKDFVLRFADIICNTVDADVIIADNVLEIVGKSFRYYTLYNTPHIGSLITRVIDSKETVIVEDKSEVETCRQCADFGSCKMIGFVGVPIIYENYVIGVISLLLPQHRVRSLFKTLDTSVEFLEHMAELLVGKIKMHHETQLLAQMVAEREMLMDLLSDAVVYTDYHGNIQHFNKEFTKRFQMPELCIGKQIQEVLPHKFFADYFEDRLEMREQKVYFESNQRPFYGLASCKAVSINGMNYGVMFLFRSVNEVLRNANIYEEKGSLVTLGWAEWMLPMEVVQAAKALAVTSNHVLICGKNRSVNEILAKGICNYSERSLNGMGNLYSDNMYRELMERFLFDEFGALGNGNKGTLFVQDAENLPCYVQERILAFLRTGKVMTNAKYSISTDVKIIFSTTKDLKKMVEQGYFLEELYYRIIEYSIEIPGIQEEKGRFYNIVSSGLQYYKVRYKRDEVELDPDVLDFLWRYPWQEDFNLLEVKLEAIVRRSNGLVTLERLMDMGILSIPEQENMTLSSIEKGRISELLKKGYSKTEVAKILGIGRATLYRKIEEYQLHTIL